MSRLAKQICELTTANIQQQLQKKKKKKSLRDCYYHRVTWTCPLQRTDYKPKQLKFQGPNVLAMSVSEYLQKLPEIMQRQWVEK